MLTIFHKGQIYDVTLLFELLTDHTVSCMLHTGIIYVSIVDINVNGFMPQAQSSSYSVLSDQHQIPKLESLTSNPIISKFERTQR